LTADVLFGCVLLLLATSRWGSYLHIPGLPLFVGDIVIFAAILQALIRWRRGSLSPRSLLTASRTGMLLGAFLLWAVLRIVTRTAVPMVAVRDFAPYAYAVAAPLTFLSPIRRGDKLRRWIYTAFTVHALWYLAATQGVVDPARTWLVAGGAPLFSTRPDFDAAVFGMALAFACHHVAFGPRPTGPPRLLALSAFVAANGLGLALQHSRSGLLAAAVAVSAVVGAWLLRPRSGAAAESKALAIRSAVATAAVVAAAMALMFTVPGRRLVGGLDGGSQAGGTSHARRLVLTGVSDWLVDSPVLTTFGVGYGPNVLARSKTLPYLEGTEFKNVRSPHNYLVGTWARLGLIGAALASILLLAAGRLGLRQLTRRTNPADVLAALVVVTIPVVALFGVILESPFGAIPYFWAVGQLCATSRRSRRDAAAPRESDPQLAGAQS